MAYTYSAVHEGGSYIKPRVAVSDKWLDPLIDGNFTGWALPSGAVISAVNVNFPFEAPKVDCVIELHTHSADLDVEIELTEIHKVVHYNDMRASFTPIGEMGLVIPEESVIRVFFKGQGFNPEVTILARVETQ